MATQRSADSTHHGRESKLQAIVEVPLVRPTTAWCERAPVSKLLLLLKLETGIGELAPCCLQVETYLSRIHRML